MLRSGRRARARRLGRRRSTASPTASRAIARARARRGRVLSLGPAADRGLLRRQQADEGLHRLGQRRHQFAAVHGLVGRRPQPRVRRRHRAGLLRGSRSRRSDRAGRLEHRVVPPGAVPAHAVAQQARARRQARGDRSAPHRDRARRPICILPIAPGMDVALFAGLLVHLADTRARLSTTSTRTRPASRTRWRARARSRLTCADGRAPTGLPRADVERFYDCSPPRRRVVTCFSQGVNQSAQGTDKVNAIINCHLATGRIGKPRHGAVLAHRPAQRDGRARGRRPRQSARRAHGFLAGRASTACAASGTRRDIATREGLKAVRDVRGGRARRDQGAVGDGDQSGGVAAARRRGARGAEQARAVRGVGERRLATTP